ncbi:MAG TPA: ATP-binding cassette domain-containing protein, partial [Polyangium sp.]|nr:ATP-binding cassette domain-containing protein [Polyangium sp.]
MFGPVAEPRPAPAAYANSHQARQCEAPENRRWFGGSGQGKSVTLKCALGLMKPDSGQVLVDGADVTKMPEEIRARVMRKFGMLFQGGALFDSLSVWENIAFRLINADKVNRTEARERAIETMRKVRLAPEFADVRPIELSGGMQKRAGLARAIIAKPDILFFDE